MKTKIITYETLKKNFSQMFMQPLITEVFYQEEEDKFTLEFEKGLYYVKCVVPKKVLINELKLNLGGKELDKESVDLAIKAFKDQFLRNGILAKTEGE